MMLSAAVVAANGVERQGVLVVKVQAQVLGKLLTDRNAPHAVAKRVEAGGENADPQPPRHNGQHTSTHTTFGRDAHIVQPLPGVVIHAAGAHQGQQPNHMVGIHQGFPGEGIAPLAG